MNQQQLQTARAALWHQNAQPLVTGDDAAAWIEDTGLCLFLPRHVQLPAPAPSFVEACMGEASLTPPAAAIARAMELAMPLIESGRVIPLNLLGTFSEQPDFLMAPEVLRWVAGVRGDRNWKLAPAGRTAPIIVRTWEALERGGEKTAAEIQETLGRELTEGAVLRALIELWGTLRVLPTYGQSQRTRWSLAKSRYAAELTAAGNTAQTTALSALVSLYLRSAVAATAEEAEVFLSPLTARSRIREVVHGMMATLQVGTTTVNTQTLLFVEGSLPEAEPEPEMPAEKIPAMPERTAFHGNGRAETPEPRRREAGRERDRPGFGQGEKAGREKRGSFGPKRPAARPWPGKEKKEWRGAAPGRGPERPAGGEKIRREGEWRPPAQTAGSQGPEKRGPRTDRPRPEGTFQRRESGGAGQRERPWQKKGPGREERPRREERPGGAGRREDRPRREGRSGLGRGFGPAREGGPSRAGTSGGGRYAGPGKPGPEKRFGGTKPRFGGFAAGKAGGQARYEGRSEGRSPRGGSAGGSRFARPGKPGSEKRFGGTKPRFGGFAGGKAGGQGRSEGRSEGRSPRGGSAGGSRFAGPGKPGSEKRFGGTKPRFGGFAGGRPSGREGSRGPKREDRGAGRAGKGFRKGGPPRGERSQPRERSGENENPE